MTAIVTHTITRKKYNKLFLVNFKLRKIAKRLIDTQPLIETPKAGVAAHMMAKSYKTHGVILHLCKNGYGEDAQMLSRTLFDSYLIVATVLDDKSDETAFQYLNYDDMDRLKMFQHIKEKPIYKEELKKRKLNPNPNQESIEDIEKRTIDWREKYGKQFRQKWSADKNMGELAKKVNLKSYYDTAFKLQSQLIHSLPRTGDFYLRDDGQRLWMNINPNPNNVDLALVSSFNMFIGTTLAFDEHFELGSETEIKSLIPEYKNAVQLDDVQKN